jgi:hypothetical protein
MASAFFSEISDLSPLCDGLASAHSAMAENLGACADKEMDAGREVALLKENAVSEAAAIEQVAALAASLH